MWGSSIWVRSSPVISAYIIKITFIKKEKHESIKYKCDYCSEKFSEKQLWIHHTKIVHQKEKVTTKPNYFCIDCDLGFLTTIDLTRHIMDKHWSKKFKCAYCVAAFEKYEDLYQHLESEHQVTNGHVSCHLCTNMFLNYGSFRQGPLKKWTKTPVVKSLGKYHMGRKISSNVWLREWHYCKIVR